MLWYLEIKQFYGKKHYTGRLKSNVDIESFYGIELDHVVSAAEAKLLSSRHYRYKAGDTSTRFVLRERLIEAGIARYQEIEGATVLFLGSERADPQRVLVGPPEFTRITNSACKTMQELGWYDGGHEAEAIAASNAWYAYFLDFKEKLKGESK